jgi:hypothetical protein
MKLKLFLVSNNLPNYKKRKRIIILPSFSFLKNQMKLKLFLVSNNLPS